MKQEAPTSLSRSTFTVTKTNDIELQELQIVVINYAVIICITHKNFFAGIAYIRIAIIKKIFGTRNIVTRRMSRLRVVTAHRTIKQSILQNLQIRRANVCGSRRRSLSVTAKIFLRTAECCEKIKKKLKSRLVRNVAPTFSI